MGFKMRFLIIFLKCLTTIIILNEIYNFSSINKIISDRYIFNNDSRQQISPFLFKNDIAKDDYIITYHKDVFMPLGIKLLYGNIIKQKHIEIFSKTIPYVLYGLFIIGVYICSSFYSNKFIGFSSLIFSILLPNILVFMQGGLSRSFAPVFLIYGLYFLSKSNYFYLGIITIAATLFYPIAGLICGASLFFSVLIDYLIKGNIFFRRNVNIVITVATLSLIFLIPSLINGSKYGIRIGENEIKTYPEAGRDGRYNRYSTPPYKKIHEAYFTINSDYMRDIRSIIPQLSIRNYSKYGWGKLTRIILWIAIFTIPLLAFYKIYISDYHYLKIFIFIFSSIFLYQLAIILEPFLYFPFRYLFYTVPIFSVVLVPNLIFDFIRSQFIKNRFQISDTSISIISMLIVIFSINLVGREYPNKFKGLMEVDKNLSILESINNTSENALIAGWPNGLIDNIPYLCTRRAYLHMETHQAFHSEYVLEMRKRFQLFLNAYFSENQKDIELLRDEEGVTHMIINKNHFFGDSYPKYMKMFENNILSIFNNNKENFFFKNYIEDKVVDESNYILIDLANL